MTTGDDGTAYFISGAIFSHAGGQCKAKTTSTSSRLRPANKVVTFVCGDNHRHPLVGPKPKLVFGTKRRLQPSRTSQAEWGRQKSILYRKVVNKSRSSNSASRSSSSASHFINESGVVARPPPPPFQKGEVRVSERILQARRPPAGKRTRARCPRRT